MASWNWFSSRAADSPERLLLMRYTIALVYAGYFVVLLAVLGTTIDYWQKDKGVPQWAWVSVSVCFLLHIFLWGSTYILRNVWHVKFLEHFETYPEELGPLVVMLLILFDVLQLVAGVISAYLASINDEEDKYPFREIMVSFISVGLVACCLCFWKYTIIRHNIMSSLSGPRIKVRYTKFKQVYSPSDKSRELVLGRSTAQFQYFTPKKSNSDTTKEKDIADNSTKNTMEPKKCNPLLTSSVFKNNTGSLSTVLFLCFMLTITVVPAASLSYIIGPSQTSFESNDRCATQRVCFISNDIIESQSSTPVKEKLILGFEPYLSPVKSNVTVYMSSDCSLVLDELWWGITPLHPDNNIFGEGVKEYTLTTNTLPVFRVDTVADRMVLVFHVKECPISNTGRHRVEIGMPLFTPAGNDGMSLRLPALPNHQLRETSTTARVAYSVIFVTLLATTFTTAYIFFFT